MKKNILLFVFTLLSTLTANAYDAQIDGIYYNLNAETMQATVTSGNIKYTGSVTIPATVNYNGVTYNVTTIGDYAFLSCTGMTSVEIPNSITSIGEYAFLCCSNLTSVIIPNSVTSIKEGIFCECSNLASIAIPNSVTSISECAFQKCSSLTSIDLPNSVTKIEGYAFQECSSLTSIIIPNSVTSIDEGAFGYCYKLASITIPNNVTSIGYGAFSGCYALTSVTIGSSVTEIGSYAFSSCSALTSIAIPKSVTSIGGNAFDYCSGLTSITVESGNTTYDSRDNCNAIIATSTNSLILGCKNTIIPNSVTSIGCGAFYGCSGLTSIVIPNSVMWLELWAFCSCSGLTSVTIGNSVQSIGHEAFRFCSNLTSVTCEAASVPSTYNNAFDDIPQSSATLYVPASALESYKATAPWSGFGKIVAIDEYEPVAESIIINGKNFPDENFRNWILSQEYGRDGVLTDEEIANMTIINVSDKNIQSMKGIECFTALQYLDCSSNNLASIDVSKNTLLRTLYCDENQLTSLDLSKNTLLMILDCSYNQLTSLDISTLTALESLQCHDNQLTSLDVSNTALVYIECYRNQLTSLDVSGCTALRLLDCEHNQLTSLDVSNKKELFWLMCYNNQLTSLDVSGCTNLMTLSIYCNQIKGAAMDKFVEDLPAVDFENRMGVIYFENEGNEMTTTQVAVAKAKNMIPYYAINVDEWQEYEGSEPEVKKCATPTISFVGGKIVFDCETEGVEFVSEVTCSDSGKYSGSEIPVTSTYTVSVYAKKDGYEDSDVATKEIAVGGSTGIKGDVNEDGTVNGTDIQEVINIIVNAD